MTESDKFLLRFVRNFFVGYGAMSFFIDWFITPWIK